MNISISDTLLEKLQFISAHAKSSSVNSIAIAIMERECDRIINILPVHDGHASTSKVASQSRASSIADSLRSEAKSFETFSQKLGPDSDSQNTRQLESNDTESTNFQYPGSTSPIRRIAKL